MVYREMSIGKMLGLYYFVSWKVYPEEDNTQGLLSAIIQLQKLVNIFRKEHSKKPMATNPPLKSTLPMARTIVLKQ